MSRLLKFDYYYGVEAEHFSLYRVPRLPGHSSLANETQVI